MRFLQNQLAQQMHQDNLAVRIRDILVSQKDKDGKGEYQKNSAVNLNNSNHYDVLDRLMAYIKDLAEIANIDHLFRNYNYNVKTGHENDVTRLLTHEYFFYTQSPLEEKEFLDLIARIEKLASRLLPNLHLLLSSFSVIIDAKVFNFAIYVQCGRVPALTVFAKAIPSKADPEYPGTLFWKFSNFTQNNPLGPLIVVPKSKCGIAVNHDGVVIAETLGGEKFFVAIDICFDFRRQCARKHLENKINMATSTQRLPSQVNHILTSRKISIDFSKDFVIGDVIVHIDFDLERQGVRNNQKFLRTDFIPPCLLKLPSAIFCEKNGSLMIEKPKFGAVAQIDFYPAYQASVLPDYLAEKVARHNADVAKQRVFSR